MELKWCWCRWCAGRQVSNSNQGQGWQRGQTHWSYSFHLLLYFLSSVHQHCLFTSSGPTYQTHPLTCNIQQSFGRVLGLKREAKEDTASRNWCKTAGPSGRILAKYIRGDFPPPELASPFISCHNGGKTHTQTHTHAHTQWWRRNNGPAWIWEGLI